jgi:hypothetical protein
MSSLEIQNFAVSDRIIADVGRFPDMVSTDTDKYLQLPLLLPTCLTVFNEI